MRKKAASQNRRNPKDRTEACRHITSIDAFRLAATDQTKRRGPEDRHRRKGLVLFSQIQKIRIWNRSRLEVRLALIHRHQLLRLWKWQWVKQHPVNNREQCCIDTDSERQGE